MTFSINFVIFVVYLLWAFVWPGNCGLESEFTLLFSSSGGRVILFVIFLPLFGILTAFPPLSASRPLKKVVCHRTEEKSSGLVPFVCSLHSSSTSYYFSQASDKKSDTRKMLAFHRPFYRSLLMNHPMIRLLFIAGFGRVQWQADRMKAKIFSAPSDSLMLCSILRA
jgi:hypothetical protein